MHAYYHIYVCMGLKPHVFCGCDLVWLYPTTGIYIVSFKIFTCMAAYFVKIRDVDIQRL